MKMHFCKRLLAFILVEFLGQVSAFPERTELSRPNVNGLLTALRRSDDAERQTFTRELSCQIDMVGLEGEYHFTSQGNEDTCIIYFLAEQNEVVEIEFLEANFQCSQDSTHVQWFDGWSMGLGSFPSEEDHELGFSDRIKTVCADDSSTLLLRAHQNAAMITFKFANTGDSLRVAFKGKQISQPCNVMAQEPSGVFTLSNHQTARNCSFSVIYPTKMSVLQMNIGDTESDATLGCQHADDYVEFLAGNGLDNSYLRRDVVLCGSTDYPTASAPVAQDDVSAGGSAEDAESRHQSSRNVVSALHANPACTHGLNIDLNCQNSVVRLVSQDESDNSVTIEYRQNMASKNDCGGFTEY